MDKVYMQLNTVYIIKELAQDFMMSPKIHEDINNNKLILTYDYEMDSGEYSLKNIIFNVTKEFIYTPDRKILPYMINAYNCITEITNSPKIDNEKNNQGYKHFIIYFDGFGAYEFISKGFLND